MLHKALIAAALLAFLSVTGCSSKFYTEQADREVYKIVAQTNQRALGRAPAFTINPNPLPALPQQEGEKGLDIRPLPPEETAASFIRMPLILVPGPIIAPLPPGLNLLPEPPSSPPPAGGAPGEAKGLPPPLPTASANALKLSVADALRLAVRASRDYQTQKETVYLTALTLTGQQHVFDLIPSAIGTTDLKSNGTGQEERVKTWDGSSTVGVSQKLAGGMVLVGALGVSALKFLNKELGDTVDSAFNVSMSQPLWRGAGQLVVQENLVQAERNTLYSVRTFARFEQTFAVGIASKYLNVLEQRDVVLNEWTNYQALVANREQADWLAKAERLPQFQVDQARQDELRAYSRWIVAREAYANSLDSFKILLGIPVTTEIALDPQELDRLAAAGLRQTQESLNEVTAVALRTRFDLANVRGGVEDALRKIKVAENGLAGDVNLVASIGYQSVGPNPQSARLIFNRGDYAAGLAISLPLDRLNERNALRQTQVSAQAARRQLDLTEDEIRLEVREALRQLDQTRESYEIQKRSVELAERRVESTQLLLQAGRAVQRDVLESQQAYVEAKNALTGALVDHTVATLEFQRDVGTLVVDEEGQIHGWVLTDNGR